MKMSYLDILLGRSSKTLPGTGRIYGPPHLADTDTGLFDYHTEDWLMQLHNHMTYSLDTSQTHNSKAASQIHTLLYRIIGGNVIGY